MIGYKNGFRMSTEFRLEKPSDSCTLSETWCAIAHPVTSTSHIKSSAVSIETSGIVQSGPESLMVRNLPKYSLRACISNLLIRAAYRGRI